MFTSSLVLAAVFISVACQNYGLSPYETWEADRSHYITKSRSFYSERAATGDVNVFLPGGNLIRQIPREKTLTIAVQIDQYKNYHHDPIISHLEGFSISLFNVSAKICSPLDPDFCVNGTTLPDQLTLLFDAYKVSEVSASVAEDDSLWTEAALYLQVQRINPKSIITYNQTTKKTKYEFDQTRVYDYSPFLPWVPLFFQSAETDLNANNSRIMACDPYTNPSVIVKAQSAQPKISRNFPSNHDNLNQVTPQVTMEGLLTRYVTNYRSKTWYAGVKAAVCYEQRQLRTTTCHSVFDGVYNVFTATESTGESISQWGPTNYSPLPVAECAEIWQNRSGFELHAANHWRKPVQTPETPIIPFYDCLTGESVVDEFVYKVMFENVPVTYIAKRRQFTTPYGPLKYVRSEEGGEKLRNYTIVWTDILDSAKDPRFISPALLNESDTHLYPCPHIRKWRAPAEITYNYYQKTALVKTELETVLHLVEVEPDSEFFTECTMRPEHAYTFADDYGSYYQFEPDIFFVTNPAISHPAPIFFHPPSTSHSPPSDIEERTCAEGRKYFTLPSTKSSHNRYWKCVEGDAQFQFTKLSTPPESHYIPHEEDPGYPWRMGWNQTEDQRQLARADYICADITFTPVPASTSPLYDSNRASRSENIASKSDSLSQKWKLSQLLPGLSHNEGQPSSGPSYMWTQLGHASGLTNDCTSLRAKNLRLTMSLRLLDALVEAGGNPELAMPGHHRETCLRSPLIYKITELGTTTLVGQMGQGSNTGIIIASNGKYETDSCRGTKVACASWNDSYCVIYTNGVGSETAHLNKNPESESTFFDEGQANHYLIAANHFSGNAREESSYVPRSRDHTPTGLEYSASKTASIMAVNPEHDNWPHSAPELERVKSNFLHAVWSENHRNAPKNYSAREQLFGGLKNRKGLSDYKESETILSHSSRLTAILFVLILTIFVIAIVHIITITHKTDALVRDVNQMRESILSMGEGTDIYWSRYQQKWNLRNEITHFRRPHGSLNDFNNAEDRV